MAGEGLIALIHQIASQKVKSQVVSDLVTGEVTSVAPLIVKVSDKLVLQENMLMLSALVKETWINVPYHEAPQHLHVVPQHTTEMSSDDVPHTHVVNPFNTELAHPQIKLWRGLKIGDKVRMIRFQAGQLYYIAEREEGITNDSEQSN